MYRDLARLSDRIYRKKGKFGDWVLSQGWELHQWFTNRGTQAALVSAPNQGWSAIVFRGSQFSDGPVLQRIVDMASNLDIRAVEPLYQGYAHAGYWRAMTRVHMQAWEMANSVTGDLDLYVTGHSLGGILAQLYGAWATTGDGAINLAGVVSFGAPKGASHDFYESMRQTVPQQKRFVQPNDWAPHWPPFAFDHPFDATVQENLGSVLVAHSSARYIAGLPT